MTRARNRLARLEAIATPNDVCTACGGRHVPTFLALVQNVNAQRRICECGCCNWYLELERTEDDGFERHAGY